MLVGTGSFRAGSVQRLRTTEHMEKEAQSRKFYKKNSASLSSKWGNLSAFFLHAGKVNPWSLKK